MTESVLPTFVAGSRREDSFRETGSGGLGEIIELG